MAGSREMADELLEFGTLVFPSFNNGTGLQPTSPPPPPPPAGPPPLCLSVPHSSGRLPVITRRGRTRTVTTQMIRKTVKLYGV